MEIKHVDNPHFDDLIWYFAYGSNISSDKFIGDRGIIPLTAARVQVPGWVLAFNIPGLPYSEPTFTSIIPRTPTSAANYSVPDIIGVAYLVSRDQYIRVIGSEGGGTAYYEIEVDAVPLEKQDADVTGPKIIARTLAAAIKRNPWPKPSNRYMSIILTGCREVQMPNAYQQYLESIPAYQPPEGRWGKFGAMLFLTFWRPVMGIMEKLTNAKIQGNGYAPFCVIWLVRFMMYLIWFTHDIFFAPIFGRGDGNVIEESRVLDQEQKPLVEKGKEAIYFTV